MDAQRIRTYHARRHNHFLRGRNGVISAIRLDQNTGCYLAFVEQNLLGQSTQVKRQGGGVQSLLQEGSFRRAPRCVGWSNRQGGGSKSVQMPAHKAVDLSEARLPKGAFHIVVDGCSVDGKRSMQRPTDRAEYRRIVREKAAWWISGGSEVDTLLQVWEEVFPEESVIPEQVCPLLI